MKKNVGEKGWFIEVVTLLDSLKTMYYLAEYVIKFGSLQQDAADLQAYLENLENKDIVDAIGILDSDPKFTDGTISGAKVLDASHPLHDAFVDILESHEYNDTTFYHECGLGDFWNEVDNPLFVGTMFVSAAEKLQGCYPDLVLYESNYQEGMVGISYYDIGNLELAFRSEAAAEAFAEDNPVEPSEYIVYNGIGWQGA